MRRRSVAKRVDGDHAHGLAARAPVAQKGIGEGGFADAGRPGQSRRMGARLDDGGVEQLRQFLRALMGLDQGQCARKPALAASGDGGQVGKRRDQGKPHIFARV